MRRIPLEKFEHPTDGFTTAGIIRTVMENAPQGINLGEMRKRVRVLDELERVGEAAFVDLEDADHAILKAAVETFQFAKATPNLLKALDAVIEATPPPTPDAPAAS